MNCEKVKAQLSAYIDGEVAEKDAAFIREHVAICADCCQEEELLRKTSALLKHWENVPAPDGFCEALLAKAEDLSPRPRRSIIQAVRPLAGLRWGKFSIPLKNARIKVAVCGAAVLILCAGVIFFARPPLRRAPMVEPLPAQIVNRDQLTGNMETLTPDDHSLIPGSPRYTTMAEIKVAGIWK